MGLKLFLVFSLLVNVFMAGTSILNYMDDHQKTNRIYRQVNRMAANDSIRIQRDKAFRDSLISVVNRQNRIIDNLHMFEISCEEKREIKVRK